jgi:hypothetical protein
MQQDKTQEALKVLTDRTAATDGVTQSHKKKSHKEPDKYYAVAKGRQTGIFSIWREAQKQVNGFIGSRFKGFKMREEFRGLDG